MLWPLPQDYDAQLRAKRAHDRSRGGGGGGDGGDGRDRRGGGGGGVTTDAEGAKKATDAGVVPGGTTAVAPVTAAAEVVATGVARGRRTAAREGGTFIRYSGWNSGHQHSGRRVDNSTSGPPWCASRERQGGRGCL